MVSTFWVKLTLEAVPYFVPDLALPVGLRERAGHVCDFPGEDRARFFGHQERGAGN